MKEWKRRIQRVVARNPEMLAHDLRLMDQETMGKHTTFRRSGGTRGVQDHPCVRPVHLSLGVVGVGHGHVIVSDNSPLQVSLCSSWVTTNNHRVEGEQGIGDIGDLVNEAFVQHQNASFAEIEHVSETRPPEGGIYGVFS